MIECELKPSDLDLKENLDQLDQIDQINIVFTGHVDHGKSTLIGRLLAETKSLPAGKLEKIKRHCEVNSKPFEYAFLLDALTEEQSQGITIDIARCFFKTQKRKYLILDAPGHVEFLKNLVTGAANADAAFLVMDAQGGMQENTRRHAYMLSLLGVKQIVVLINKMDLVFYSQARFLELKNQCLSFFKNFKNKNSSLEPLSFIPVSGRAGDNIIVGSQNMPWYSGLSLVETLDQFYKPGYINRKDQQDFRMYVQDVYKFTKNNDDRRIIAGQVSSGRLNIGDRVVFFPSGKISTVKTIEGFNQPTQFSVSAGYSTGFTLQDPIYIQRGEMAALESQSKLISASCFNVSVFWLGKHPLKLNQNYGFKMGTLKTQARIEKMIRVMDTASLETYENCSEVKTNQAAECVIQLLTPIAFDPVFSESSLDLSRFVLIDNYDIAGGGLIKSHITLQVLDPASQALGQIIWFTGLSGAGKTTLANSLKKSWESQGKTVCILDGDGIRAGMNSDLGFDEISRQENIRRLAELAVYLAKQGFIILVSAISPHRNMREFARNKAHENQILFAEIYVKASLEICEKRDPKKLYLSARSKQLKNFTGIDSVYEPPENPELVLETEKLTLEEANGVMEGFFRGLMRSLSKPI